MHSKRKGNIGQFAVGLILTERGYSIFTEEGDISKIDIIAEKDGKLLRFQVKAATPVGDSIVLHLKKSGPNYQFKYKSSEFDYFALVNLETLKVYFIPSSILDERSQTVTLRLKETSGNNNWGIRYANQYLPENILK